jgi:hypothetical protein
MKKHLFRLLLVSVIAVFMTVFMLKADARSTEADDKLKGDNRAGCVEVIEAKNGAPSCTTANSISIKLKVSCDKPVDIQVTYKGIHNGKTAWLAKTFMNKKQGDEITIAECDASGPYTISKRKAGSDDPFPTPR